MLGLGASLTPPNDAAALAAALLAVLADPKKAKANLEKLMEAENGYREAIDKAIAERRAADESIFLARQAEGDASEERIKLADERKRIDAANDALTAREQSLGKREADTDGRMKAFEKARAASEADIERRERAIARQAAENETRAAELASLQSALDRRAQAFAAAVAA